MLIAILIMTPEICDDLFRVYVESRGFLPGHRRYAFRLDEIPQMLRGSQWRSRSQGFLYAYFFHVSTLQSCVIMT